MDAMQHFKVPYLQVFCLFQIFWHFHKPKETLQSSPQKSLPFFQCLRCFSAQIPFCVFAKPNTLNALQPQVFCVHNIISSFIKLYKHFRIHYENDFSFL
jgi:hypothetical protein